jgi:hypothetical protein
MRGRKRLGAYIIAVACLAASCSIPSLEAPECTASRNTVKEFYSFHFGNDMHFSAANLETRSKFLTPDFAAKLGTTGGDGDVFTTGDADFPKAFRVGGCTVKAPDETRFSVLLFWRDDVRSEQREIFVDTRNINGSWLIDSVTR